MANIKPLGQRVLVKRLEADAVSAGGIVLPDTAKEKPQEAEVISLGTGGKDGIPLGSSNYALGPAEVARLPAYIQ